MEVKEFAVVVVDDAQWRTALWLRSGRPESVEQQWHWKSSKRRTDQKLGHREPA